MDSLPKNKPLTFSSLYEIKVANAVSTKKKGLKAYRTVVQRLLMVDEAINKSSLPLTFFNMNYYHFS